MTHADFSPFIGKHVRLEYEDGMVHHGFLHVTDTKTQSVTFRAVPKTDFTYTLFETNSEEGQGLVMIDEPKYVVRIELSEPLGPDPRATFFS